MITFLFTLSTVESIVNVRRELKRKKKKTPIMDHSYSYDTIIVIQKLNSNYTTIYTMNREKREPL